MDEQLDEHGARREHVESFPGYRVPRTNFDEALHALTAIPYRLSRDGRRAAMIRALDYQATWGQIKHWRAGRRRVPQWALDLLDMRLAEKERSAAVGRQLLRAS